MTLPQQYRNDHHTQYYSTMLRPPHKLFSCTVTGYFHPSWLLQSLTLNHIYKQAKIYSVLSPRGGFGELSPLKQSSKPPQIETWSTINQWSICQFLECQAPRTNAKPPIENFLATVLNVLRQSTPLRTYVGLCVYVQISRVGKQCANHSKKWLNDYSTAMKNRTTSKFAQTWVTKGQPPQHVPWLIRKQGCQIVQTYQTLFWKEYRYQTLFWKEQKGNVSRQTLAVSNSTKNAQRMRKAWQISQNFCNLNKSKRHGKFQFDKLCLAGLVSTYTS